MFFITEQVAQFTFTNMHVGSNLYLSFITVAKTMHSLKGRNFWWGFSRSETMDVVVLFVSDSKFTDTPSIIQQSNPKLSTMDTAGRTFAWWVHLYVFAKASCKQTWKCNYILFISKQTYYMLRTFRVNFNEKLWNYFMKDYK